MCFVTLSHNSLVKFTKLFIIIDRSYSALDFDVKEFKKSSFDLPSVKDLPKDNDSSYHDDGRTPEQRARDLKRYTSICKGMTLAVAYGANIGGTGTLTGTTPNIIMKDAADR